MIQWRDLAVLIVLHSGHNEEGSNVSNKFINSILSFTRKPGSMFRRKIWITIVIMSEKYAIEF
jgi:hypothetical protein